jgi:hypothetical protein
MAVPADEQVLVRIGFAQRWLERAQRYYSEGNPARSVLTLALAGAEVRRALEVAGLAPRRSAWPTGALAVLVAAVLAALVWAGRADVPGAAQASGGPTVLRLPETSGVVLASLSFPAPAENPVPAAVRSRPPQPAAPAPVHPVAVPGLPTPAPAPAPQVVPVPPAAPEAVVSPVSVLPSARGGEDVLSVDELVELVLTADRTLRREPLAP